MPGERDQVAEVIENSALPYNNLQQTLALGLLVMAKHDRADDQAGPGYTDGQLADMDRFTRGEMDRFREQASIMLTQFSSYLTLGDVAALRAGWLVPIAQGLISAFLYSVFLILIAILARLGGHDLIDIMREALRPGG